MVRKSKPPVQTKIVYGDDEKTEKVELAKEIAVENPESVQEKLVEQIAAKPKTEDDKVIEKLEAAPERKVFVVEVPDEVSEDQLKDLGKKLKTKTSVDYSVLKGIGISIADYAAQEGDETAIKLLQKILGIAKTGVLDYTTESAYAGSPAKFELIDDYNNMRKASYKDLTDIRVRSKKELRDS